VYSSPQFVRKDQQILTTISCIGRKNVGVYVGVSFYLVKNININRLIDIKSDTSPATTYTTKYKILLRFIRNLAIRFIKVSLRI
jgi:hypothetical protein